MFGRRCILSLGLLALPGCHSCANDHPYVPAAADASAGAPTDAGAVATKTDGGVQHALVLPEGATTWKSGGGIAIDGNGSEIASVLARDFDGDGREDALAILRPSPAERKPGSPSGQLVFVHGGDTGRPPAAISVGPLIGQWPSCVATARLEAVGPRAAYAEIGSACPKAVGTRGIVVVRLGGPVPTVSFDATVTDPKDSAPMAIDVDPADRDKDGLDDVTLHLTVEGLEAKLAFYDRPAGPSRDPEEPDASMQKIAARVKAAKAKDIPALADQVRILYRAMCEEGGAPRITGIRGAGAVSCGSSKTLEDIGIAQVKALAQEGDVFGAFFAAEIAQAAPATKTAKRKDEIDKYLALAAPTAEARSTKSLSVPVDAPVDAQPQWGPLAFEPGGKLLVRKGKSVSRVDLESGEVSATEQVAWNSEVLSPDQKKRWIEAYQACEGTAFRASFAILDTDGMVEASLPFAPRLGRGCTGHGDPVLAQPIAWGNRGLEAIVAGRAVLIKEEEASLESIFLDERAPMGSPRARGSAAFATAVPTALLAQVEGKWSVVKSPDLRPSDLRACTIEDTGARIACVQRGKVLVITR
jgi:hypothetical protein